MRLYKQQFADKEVDLDDPQTYKNLPQTLRELLDIIYSEIGYAYCYMNFYRKDIFKKKIKSGYKQKKRVKKLIETFTYNQSERYNEKDILWFQEQLFLFQDETENMC